MRLTWLLATFALLLTPTVFAAEGADPALEKAVAGPQRSPQNTARDSFRHPLEELTFFGIKPTMTVVEIWPSGGYWTEILAPYLRDQGVYYVAPPPDTVDQTKKKLDAMAAIYGDVKVTAFGKDHYDVAPPNSADLVVTFRNLHDWIPQGYGSESFVAFYKALKPGGILGIEDHRARTDRPEDARTGYVRQDSTIKMAEKAGFKFIGSSEIDANPKDTKDWPAGVWTLPPTFRLGDQDRAKYAAIGEADNFVLKFQKPAR